VQQNPRRTAREVRTEAGGDTAYFSLSTVQRCLRRTGLLSYRPVKSPSLSASQ